MPYRLLIRTLAVSTALFLMTLCLTTLTLTPAGCSAGGSASMDGPDPRAEGEMDVLPPRRRSTIRAIHRATGRRRSCTATSVLEGLSRSRSATTREDDSRRLRAPASPTTGAACPSTASGHGTPSASCSNGVTTDHLICFQCSNWMTWIDDEQTGGGDTSDRPRETFDRILDDCAASS